VGLIGRRSSNKP